MAASANILMSITALGANKAKLQFAAVAAAVVMVGVKLNKVRKEAEEFALKWNAMTQQQKGFALAMDAAGKGLIDTGQALKSTRELLAAQVPVTKELTAALGRIATAEGLKAGETYEQINQRVAQLTKSVTTLRTTALKQYGIDIKSTSDRTKALAEITEKMIARAEGLVIEINNIDQAIDAAQNNIDTFIGLMWASASGAGGATEAFGDFSKAIGFMNSTLADSPDHFMDVLFSVETLEIGIMTMTNTTWGLRDGIIAWAEALGRARVEAAYFAKGKAFGEAALADVEGQRQSQLAALGMVDPLAAQETKGKKKKVGGGGAPRAETEADLVFGELDVLAVSQEIAAFGMAMGDVFRENFVRRGLNVTSEDVELMGGEAGTEEMWQAQQDALALAKEKELEIERRTAQEKFELERELLEQKTVLNEEVMRQERKRFDEDKQYQLQKTSEFFSYLSLLSTTNSKKMFQVGKVAAIAEAGVNTALGAIKAYQSMAGIPYVGPVLGALAAAAVTAAGAAAIARIRAQKFGGGGAGSYASSAAGGVSAGAASGGYGDAGMGAGGGGGGTTVIQLNLDGDQIHESIVHANDKADQQGKQSFAAAS
jgi:hypothetical protein